MHLWVISGETSCAEPELIRKADAVFGNGRKPSDRFRKEPPSAITQSFCCDCDMFRALAATLLPFFALGVALDSGLSNDLAKGTVVGSALYRRL